MTHTDPPTVPADHLLGVYNRAPLALARDERLLPPLIITVEETREAIEKLERTCAAARAKAATSPDAA